MLETIVGSAAAERVLLYLQNYEQAYGREISATFELSNSQVQKQLLKLESGGLVVSRRIGRTRLYQWNPRNPLVPSLRAFLAVALDSLPANEQQQFFRQADPAASERQGAVMQLSATSTVEEVAAVVSDALTSAGITAVLSGGAAVQSIRVDCMNRATSIL